jgi:hypothetical protein
MGILPALNVRAHTTADRKTVSGFQDILRQHGFSGRVVSCQNVVVHYASHRGGDVVYGGICSLKVSGKPDIFLLCYDEVVGHLGILAGNFRDDVEQFMNEYCSGG